MTMPPTPVTLTLLEKVAVDNGFDRELPRQGDWLGFASTHVPLRLWLATLADTVYIAALSQIHVARALGEYGTPLASPLPAGAAAARTVAYVPALHRLVRRAFQLSKNLPDELLHDFEQKTAALPRTTKAERLVVQRIGQDLFRDKLLEFWEGRCAITGLAVPDLLRASHIKPWADCATGAERLDAFNGLLLAAHLDAAFDAGFVTVEDDGVVVVSKALDGAARALLGLDRPRRIRGLQDGHRADLPWHRNMVFRDRVERLTPTRTGDAGE
ncbi:MAG: HNH endonuclease [Deltaproteobacteria bacterium]|nr:HNH endonuclease [Deltaproteobacteria bacterium]